MVKYGKKSKKAGRKRLGVKTQETRKKRKDYAHVNFDMKHESKFCRNLMKARQQLGRSLTSVTLPKNAKHDRCVAAAALIPTKHYQLAHDSSAIQLLYSVREAVLTRCFSRAAAILSELFRIQVEVHYPKFLSHTVGGHQQVQPYLRGHCLQLGWTIFMTQERTQEEILTYADFTKANSRHNLKRYAFTAVQRLYQLKGVNNDFEAMKKRAIAIDRTACLFRASAHSENKPRRFRFFNQTFFIFQPWLNWFTGLIHYFRWCEESNIFGDVSEFCVKKLEQNPEVINQTQSNLELKKMYLDAHLDLGKASFQLPIFPAQTFLLMHLYITMGEYDKAVNVAQYEYKGNLQSVDALALYALTLRAVGQNVSLSQVEWAKLYLKALKLDPLQLAALRDLHLQYVDGGVAICMLVEGFLTHLDVCMYCKKVGLESYNYDDEDQLVCPSNAWQYLSECLNQAAEQALLYLPEDMDYWVELYKDKVRMEVDNEADEDSSMWNQWLIISQMIQDRAYWWQHTHFNTTEIPKAIMTHDQGKDLCYRSICACYMLGCENKYVKRTNKIFKKYEQLQSERKNLKRSRLICYHVVNTYNEVKTRQNKEGDHGDILVYKEKQNISKERYGVFQSCGQSQDAELEGERKRELPKEWWQMFPFKRNRTT